MSRTAKRWLPGLILTLGVAATVACTPAERAGNSSTADLTPGSGGQSPVTATVSPAGSAGNGGMSPDSKAGRLVSSDVSQLETLGIDLNVGVLVDVADDGLDRYMEVRRNGVVDFTGTERTDNTMMALKPAQVRKRDEASRNRVVIAPPFYNEDLGRGYCVADTAPGVLKLATCVPGSAAQTWQVIPAGDSGQFELHGPKTAIRVHNGRITTGSEGYVGLQTIKFAE
jgi:hypothetical protein